MNPSSPEQPPTFRLTVDFPHGVLPDGFAVVSSAVAQKVEDISQHAPWHGSDLASVLEIKKWKAYPALVEASVFNNEPRVSFAVVENLAKLERVMREFCRPQVFWVQRGMVHQTFFGAKKPICLGPYDRFSGRPPVELSTFGNLELLDRPATAFLCSTQCPGDKILEAYDWARRQCDERGTVVSGFHTPVEKDVLAILARRGANILWVPGRDVPASIDPVLKAPMLENRLLIVSPFAYGQPSRASRESCSERNRFVLRRWPDRYIPHVAPGSSLISDLEAVGNNKV
jgi:hypothetical protein